MIKKLSFVMVPGSVSRAETDVGEVDGDGDDGFFGFDEYDEDDGADIPQLFLTHDSPDADAEASELNYGDQLVDKLVHVKAKPLTFSKLAKRVDVQRLKENLWTSLSETPGDVSEDMPRETNETKKMNETKTFNDVVSKLDTCYPEKTRGDISVAFCFICVLHLANENHLKIEGDGMMKNLVISG